MASLGSLVIELAANTARLSSDLGRATSLIEGFARRAKTGLSVLGVGVGAGLFADLAKEAINLGDELQKGASRAGIAAGTFSQLAAAAKQSDIDIGTLSKGLKNMQVAISTAAQGGKEAQSAFRQLGVNLNEIRQASPDEQLKIIADALKRIRRARTAWYSCARQGVSRSRPSSGAGRQRHLGAGRRAEETRQHVLGRADQEAFRHGRFDQEAEGEFHRACDDADRGGSPCAHLVLQ